MRVRKLEACRCCGDISFKILANITIHAKCHVILNLVRAIRKEICYIFWGVYL